MPLVAPNLDTRTFEQIVAEVRRRIPTYTPEWTDLNDSDPGMTLAQLFAFMSEQLLFQVNQVPNKGLVTFLKMVGAELHPAVPAVADVTFIPIGGTDVGAPLIVEIDERTQVQTAAPPPGQTTPLTFETIQAFTRDQRRARRHREQRLGRQLHLAPGGQRLGHGDVPAPQPGRDDAGQPSTSSSISNVTAGSPPWPAAAFRFRVNVAGSTDGGRADQTPRLPARTPRIAWSYSSGADGLGHAGGDVHAHHAHARLDARAHPERLPRVHLPRPPT